MKSREEVERELCSAITTALQKGIQTNGEASLLVSGGSTPIQLFKLLSKSDIEWKKVRVSLVDERFVKKNDENSNEYLVRNYLLKNNALEANFIPLLIDDTDGEVNLQAAKKLINKIPQPFTVIILGMGTDGHTASLFPDAPQLKLGMDLNFGESLLITEPQAAPFKRISFSRKAILNAKNIYLHYYGLEKKAIIEQVKEAADYEKFPIAGFLNQKQIKIQTYWAK